MSPVMHASNCPGGVFADVVSGLVKRRHADNEAREALGFTWSVASTYRECRLVSPGIPCG